MPTYTDNNVNYSYTIGIPTASVISSPSATGDITILSSFTVSSVTYIVNLIGQSAFLNCTGITSISIPSSVTSIGASAFNNTGLITLNIPSTVATISDYAFASCSKLVDVTVNNYYSNFNIIFSGGSGTITTLSLLYNGIIPNNFFLFWNKLVSVTIGSGITSIEFSAFQYCNSITSINIPSTVLTIGNNAFNRCDKLVDITINNYYSNLYNVFGNNFATGSYNIGLQIAFLYTGEIPNSVCNGWTNLASVIFDPNITSISLNAFNTCTNLTNITIPSLVTEIGNYAFRQCRSFTSISIPDSVITIGDGAFESCTSLASITLNSTSSLTTIGTIAFSYCPITSLYIPASVTSIGSEVISHATNLVDITINSNFTGLYNFLHSNNTLKQGAHISFLYSGTIPDNACSNLLGLTSVTIGPNITSIGANAFYNSGLTSVLIPDLVTTIGAGAFAASKITSIDVPSSVVTIGNNAFKISSLINIIVRNYYSNFNSFFAGDGWGQGVNNIGLNISFLYSGAIPNNACVDFYNLASVTIGPNITSIGEYAFKVCINLTKVVVPSSVTSIGANAFLNDVFSINDCKFTTIGFSEDDSIVIDPNGSLSSIGANAFVGQYKITRVEIPATVTSIGNNAFNRCSKITNIIVRNEYTNFNSIFGAGFAGSTNNIGLSTSFLYNGVIPDNACIYWSNLESIVIGEGITQIGGSAFYRCGIRGPLVFPSTLTTIRTINSGVSGAFDSCGNITSVTLEPTLVTIEDGTFVNCGKIVSILAKNYYSNFNKIFAGNSGFAQASNNIGLVVNFSYNGAIPDDACSSFYNMAQIIIGEGITSIGNRAFIQANVATVEDLPDSITTIGDEAFRRSSIVSLRLSRSITSIGAYAFETCNNLVKINLPDSLTTIGTLAFQNCGALKQLTVNAYFPNLASYFTTSYNLDKIIFDYNGPIPDNVCNYNTQLKTVIIGQSITGIGNGSFNNCPLLESVTLPDTIVSIGTNAFSGCSSLKKIAIPAYVANIGLGAFACQSLTDVYFLSTSIPLLTDNGYNNFVNTNDTGYYVTGARNLSRITHLFTSLAKVPLYIRRIVNVGDFMNVNFIKDDDLINIVKYAISLDGELTYIELPDQLTSPLSIPSTYFEDGETYSISIKATNNLNVTTTSTPYPFKYGKSVNYSYTIEEANSGIVVSSPKAKYSEIILDTFTSGGFTYYVRTIDDYSFYNCFKLTSISIPNTISSIGDSAFAKSGLLEIIIPNSVTSVGPNVFSDCQDLSVISFDTGSQLTNIGSYMFKNCLSIETITIPDSVTSIGEFAFYGCTGLTSIIIPNSVTSIHTSAFYGCTGLTTIILPSSLVNVGSSLFLDCSNLTSIIINSYLVNLNTALSGISNTNTQITFNYTGAIPESACFGITNIKSVTIGSQITSIGNSAFSGCSAISSITIPSSVTSIGQSVLRNCTSLIIVRSFGSVTAISANSFRGCSSLTSVILSDTITDINSSAFQDCSSLPSISLPSSLINIEESAFLNCSSITSISFPSSCVSIGPYSFSGTGLTYAFITSTLASIGIGSFSKCLSLLGILVDNANPNYSSDTYSILFNKDKTILIQYPNGLNSVYTIPNTVVTIGESAFQYSQNISSVTVPTSVTSILDYAFNECNSLLSVTFLGNVPTIGSFNFGPQSGDTVYYKAGTPNTSSLSVFSYQVTLKQPAPVITNVSVLEDTITFNFTQTLDPELNTITNYAYSIDRVNFINLSVAQTSGPITIEGLRNGNASITIKGINDYGDVSSVSNSLTYKISFDPSQSAPVLTNNEFEPGKYTIHFTQPPLFPRKGAITNYKYSIDGGLTFKLANTITSPIVIKNLKPGIKNLIALTSYNGYDSELSNIFTHTFYEKQGHIV